MHEKLSCGGAEMILIVAIAMCMIIVVHYSMSRVININDVHTVMTTNSSPEQGSPPETPSD